MRNLRFSLSYGFFVSAISEPSVTSQQMESLIDQIVDGLFSICAVLGVVPVIRCPKDNAAEQVAAVRYHHHYNSLCLF